jgi:hypothetical protein
MTYAESVAKLPVPTLEQTAHFAEHVAENHSWYKHLPFYPPGVSFVFFLNPHAGMGVRELNGIATPYDLPVGDYFQHHSRLATAEYRTRFGHWDYWVLENPRHVTRVPEPGIVERFKRRFGRKRQMNEQPDGPWGFGIGENGRMLLPEEPRLRGRCWFTAFLRPSPNMFNLVHADVLRTEAKAFQNSSRDHPGDPEIALYAWFAREAAGRGDVDWGQAPLFAYVMDQSDDQLQRWLGDMFRIGRAPSRQEFDASRPGAELVQNWLHARNIESLRHSRWGARELLSFMEAAARFQKERMLDTLHAILEPK